LIANFLKKRLGIIAAGRFDDCSGAGANVQRGVVRACLFVLAGMLAPQLSSFPAAPDSLVAAIALFAIAIAVLRRVDLLLFLLGAGLFLAHAAVVIDGRLDARFAGDSLLADVRIADFPRPSTNSVSLVATSSDPRLPERIRLSWFEAPVTPRLGDVWRLELRLRRPRGSMNPGTMDYEAWLFRQRVGATGYVVNGPHNRLLQSGRLGPVERIRAAFVARLTRDFGDDPGVAVLAAVTVGARHRITPDAWERYALTGTTHLVAISGLHVGLAAAAAYGIAQLLFGCAAQTFNAHRAALLASLGVAAAYGAVAGFAVPALRATLMLAIGTAALVAARPSPPLRIVALAALVIMLADPLATMAPGFRLSFSAVLILIALAARMVPRAAGRLALLSGARNLLLAQTLLLAGLAPLTALTFGRVSFAAPLINFLAVPVFTFVTVPFALAGLTLGGAAAALGDLAIAVALASIGWIEALVGVAASRPGAATFVAEPAGFALLLVLLPVVWVLLPPGWPGRAAAWLGFIALVALRPAPPPAGCVDIRALDVGQGLAMVVRTASHVLLYDTGPAYRTGGSAAERVVVPYLERRRITRIDRLVLSHADLDHAGGADVLATELEVDDVLAGEPGVVDRDAIRACRRGERWKWDGVRFSVLHPQRAGEFDGNDASCVLAVAVGEYRALLTGDIEAAAERALLRSMPVLRYSVVAIPHHGSRTSSTAPFVRVVAPRVAVVSAGYGNQWGLPRGDVVARWREHGARVLSTAVSGSIRVRLCEDRGIVSVDEYRERARRLWHESG
jgi:competence protein ComEC